MEVLWKGNSETFLTTPQTGVTPSPNPWTPIFLVFLKGQGQQWKHTRTHSRPGQSHHRVSRELGIKPVLKLLSQLVSATRLRRPRDMRDVDWTELSFESGWELATGTAQGWKGLEAEKCCRLQFLIRPHPGTQREKPDLRGGAPHCAAGQTRWRGAAGMASGLPGAGWGRGHFERHSCHPRGRCRE